MQVADTGPTLLSTHGAYVLNECRQLAQERGRIMSTCRWPTLARPARHPWCINSRRNIDSSRRATKQINKNLPEERRRSRRRRELPANGKTGNSSFRSTHRPLPPSLSGRSQLPETCLSCYENSLPVNRCGQHVHSRMGHMGAGGGDSVEVGPVPSPGASDAGASPSHIDWGPPGGVVLARSPRSGGPLTGARLPGKSHNVLISRRRMPGWKEPPQWSSHRGSSPR